MDAMTSHPYIEDCCWPFSKGWCDGDGCKNNQNITCSWLLDIHNITTGPQELMKDYGYMYFKLKFEHIYRDICYEIITLL